MVSIFWILVADSKKTCYHNFKICQSVLSKQAATTYPMQKFKMPNYTNTWRGQPVVRPRGGMRACMHAY